MFKMKLLPLTIILPFLILTSSHSLDLTKKEKADAYKVTNLDLPIPKILCPNKSAYEYITDEAIYKDKSRQILLGIQIDNYSAYTLKNPVFIPNKGSSVTTVNGLGAVRKRRTEFFILENVNNDMSGSLSWEVFLGMTHKGKRLIVTFKVPYSVACANSDRGHQYTLYLQDIKTNTTHWIPTSTTNPKYDYDNYHRDNNGCPSTWGKKDDWLLRKYGSLVIETSITKSTCTPILQIRFLGNLNNFREENFKGLSKTCICEQSCGSTPKRSEQYGHTLSEMSIEKMFMIIIGSVIGGMVFLMVAAILFLKWQKSKRLQGS